MYPQSQKRISLHLILTIFLAIGMLVFGILAVIAYRDNEFVRGNLNQIVEAEKQKTKSEQKALDAEENRKANDNPYRTFTAQPVDGGFQLQIPKTWSVYNSRATTGKVQVNLIANPDVITNNTGSGAQNTQAFRLQLLRTTQQEVVKTYGEAIKKKQLSSKGVTVSGISGTQLEGTIDAQRHTGVVIIVPVRDKTMVFITEDRKYLDEFNKIVAAAKITP